MARLSHPLPSQHRQLSKLKRERMRLWRQVSSLDEKIIRLTHNQRHQRPLPLDKLDALFDALSNGLGELNPLPGDFSRGDLYDDHD